MNGTPRDLLEFLARSDNRMTLLMAFTPGATVTRAELQSETGIPRSTVSRILDEFSDAGLICRVNSRYKVRPFGGVVAERLHAMFDSIEAMQSLQLLLTQVADTDSDITVTDTPRGEILTLTSTDQGAPARRLSDLLQTASQVGLLVPAAVPALFDVASAFERRSVTFEMVTPRVELEAVRDHLGLARPHGGGNVRVFSYDGDVPYFVGTIDETALVGLFDDAGTIRGFIETDDDRVRAWTDSTVEAYIRRSERVPLHALTE